MRSAFIFALIVSAISVSGDYNTEDDYDDPYEQFDPLPQHEAGDQALIDDAEDAQGVYEAPSCETKFFLETFQSDWRSGWLHSEETKYSGKFQVGTGPAPSIPGDKGLIVPHRGLFYAISTSANIPSQSHGTLVVQFEVKAPTGFTCSGAYLKLLAAPFRDLSQFNDSVPYSVMFGPDKCGENDFTRLVYQTKNPKTGTLTEHHLLNPPGSFLGFDKKTHLFTLILQGSSTAGNSFEIRIDQQVQRKGSLWSPDDFSPPRRPQKRIIDPNDKKPADWEDNKLIQDPSHTKPSGHNDETDGAWEPRMISNPNYKGIWKPRKIENPEFYDAGDIGLLESTAIGIDIWTVDHSIIFDNILVTDDIYAAEDFASKTWRVKRNTENDRFRKEAHERFLSRSDRREKSAEMEEAEEEDGNEAVDFGNSRHAAGYPVGTHLKAGFRDEIFNFISELLDKLDHSVNAVPRLQGFVRRIRSLALSVSSSFNFDDVPTTAKALLLASLLLFVCSMFTFFWAAVIAKQRNTPVHTAHSKEE